MSEDPTFSAHNSPEVLDYYRKRAIKDLGYTPTFTCETCVWAPTCIYAYDAYNTDGDCLAEK